MDGKSCSLRRLGVLDRVRDRCIWTSGVANSGRVLKEGDQRRRRQAEEAAAGCEVFERLGNRADAARLGVVGDARVLHAPDDARVDVVAKILAHRRQRVGHLDAVRLQDFRAGRCPTVPAAAGVAMAPAERMTSRLARAYDLPPCS